MSTAEELTTLQTKCLDYVKKVNEQQKLLFLKLEPLLGVEEAAVVMGSMTMKYIKKLSDGDETLDKEAEIHSLAQTVAAHTLSYGEALRKMVAEDAGGSVVRETVKKVQKYHNIHDADVFVTSS